MNYIDNILQSPLIKLLIICSVLNLITDIEQKWTFFNNNRGIIHDFIIKATIIFSVLLIYPFFKTNGYKLYVDSIILFYCGIYGKSILENLMKMGIPVPLLLKNIIKKVIKNVEDKGKK